MPYHLARAILCKIPSSQQIMMEPAWIQEFQNESRSVCEQGKKKIMLTLDCEIVTNLTLQKRWDLLPGDPKKYSCLIKRKMHNKRDIFKIEKFLNYQ